VEVSLQFILRACDGGGYCFKYSLILRRIWIWEEYKVSMFEIKFMCQIFHSNPKANIVMVNRLQLNKNLSENRIS